MAMGGGPWAVEPGANAMGLGFIGFAVWGLGLGTCLSLASISLYIAFFI